MQEPGNLLSHCTDGQGQEKRTLWVLGTYREETIWGWQKERGAPGTKVCKEALNFRVLSWLSGTPSSGPPLPIQQVGKFLA